MQRNFLKNYCGGLMKKKNLKIDNITTVWNSITLIKKLLRFIQKLFSLHNSFLMNRKSNLICGVTFNNLSMRIHTQPPNLERPRKIRRIWTSICQQHMVLYLSYHYRNNNCSANFNFIWNFSQKPIMMSGELSKHEWDMHVFECVCMSVPVSMYVCVWVYMYVRLMRKLKYDA